jgi:uncharacterized repeat protein (TIGR03803 family)
LVVSGNAIYGMTAGGGVADDGVIFRMNTDGTGFALLHTFVASTGDGWAPHGSLVLSGSTLYGMTSQGGGGAGSIFQINTDGTGYSRLHAFAGGTADGSKPLGDLLIAGNTLYGPTSLGGTFNLGTIFEINTDGSGYGLLHSFAGAPNDGNGPSNLIISGSTLYGMTGAGGLLTTARFTAYRCQSHPVF